MYGDDTELSRMNYHKIAALYIRAFLKYQPFYLDPPALLKEYESCKYTVLANEYFSFSYLAAIFRGWNKDFYGVLALDKPSKETLIKLLYRYKNNLDLLDPITLSVIIEYIEKNYFHRGTRGK